MPSRSPSSNRAACISKTQTGRKKQLETVNYYRLSGYWHTMRQIDPDTGRSLNISKPGSSFSLTEPFSSGLVVEVEDDEYYGGNYGGSG